MKDVQASLVAFVYQQAPRRGTEGLGGGGGGGGLQLPHSYESYK